ncbi:MAG: dephospho-CoA kinase [Desulfovibrio sp.]|nr:dephospho-CoA kinase [Desulfovibrio sp.]
MPSPPLENNVTATFTPNCAEQGLRLDRFLAQKLNASRVQVRQAIENGNCNIDGHVSLKPDLKIVGQPQIAITLQNIPSTLNAEDGPVDILYADTEIIVVNKPHGLTVHPCPSQPKNTLIQRLIARFPDLATMLGPRPGIVHRIDKDTSGLLLIARTEKIRLLFTNLFAEHKIHKEYLALVHGVPPLTGNCNLPIGRHPTQKTKMAVLPNGKTAQTHWERLWVAPDNTISLLKVVITTGRTHQIRVHLAHLGFPLLGDSTYGTDQGRQMLHAHKLSFLHPVNQTNCTFVCPPPSDFIQAALEHTHLLQKIVITGNPASGKSWVTQYFAKHGYPTFSADEEVAKLYTQKNGLPDWLANHGGQDLVTDDGIDRAKIMQKLQKDPIFKRELEAILHKSVHERLQKFWQTANSPIAFAEIPLWFECSFHDNVLTICVTAPQEERFRRLAQNRGWSMEKAATIESWQWEEGRKARASDFVLDNDTDIPTLAKKADACLQKLIEHQTNSSQEQEKKFIQFVL